MPYRQSSPPPTLYDAMGRPIVNRAINWGVNKGLRYGLGEASKYWGSQAATDTATSGAATTAGTEGGQSALSSAWSSAAPYLPFVGVALAAYLNYQKGSGRNDPEIRRGETHEAGRQLLDLSKGKKVDQGEYGIPSKYLPGKTLVSWNNFDQVQPELDPEGYSPAELYDMMHKGGAGYGKMLATDSSGETDKEIDDKLYAAGLDRRTLADMTGMEIPDWSNGLTYADWVQKNNERENPQGNVMNAETGPTLKNDAARQAYLDYLAKRKG